MSKLPRPSTSRKSTMSRQSTSRPSTSRPSTSRLSVFTRPSSVGAGGPKIDIKANTKKNIKEILQYLMDKEYPTTITKKNLMNPTEATFKNLLKFIIQEFYPDFECTRVAQSVMELMADFDYPYPLKDSHFKPVGSPHSWPYLLEVLNWLCGMARNIEYEMGHVSQLVTLNCKDEDEAEDELKHQVLMSKYYRQSANEVHDFSELKERYILELDINGTVKHLQEENKRLQDEIDIVKDSNKKHSEDESKFKQHITQVYDEIAVLDDDKVTFDNLISNIKDEGEGLQNQLNDKKEQLDVLNLEVEIQKGENARLEEIIMNQPPQHEVQKIKQHYSDLLDKKTNLEKENKAIAEDNAMREVIHFKQQRELKERMRKLICEIREDIPSIKYDCDKPIDNKSIIQAMSIIEKLKKNISEDKEESRELDSKSFDLKMEIQRLEDDLRLNTEKQTQTNNNLTQKESSRQLMRQECIAKSENMSQQLEKTKKSVAELEKQLRACDSPEIIEQKIREEDEAIATIASKLQIYNDIAKHRSDETFYRYQDLSYKFEYSLMLKAEKVLLIF